MHKLNTTYNKLCPLRTMISYATGDCAVSLVMNSVFGFAMLYYTDALGLKPSLAGFAMFIASLWDAVSAPIMGHITDNTRSRFGRRHPFILLGGIGMIVCFYFVWVVPSPFKESMTVLFWYLVVMNLLLRTFCTIFSVPFTALGFEMCTDYIGRTKLQGVRTAIGMLANFFGPALSWSIFFRNNNEGFRATNNSDNFIHMGTAFSIFAFLFILIVCISTFRYMMDSRELNTSGKGLKAFYMDMKEIALDKFPRGVFAFLFFVVLGITLTSTLQMYLYEHYMKLEGMQKTFAHGGTMIGMALGAAAAARLTKLFDKKKSIVIAVIWSVFCNVVLAVLLLPGWLKPNHTFIFSGIIIPIVFIAFVFFHSAYWFGNGIMLPISLSMMADVSEINEARTGINKDGSYSAVYSFVSGLGGSVGALFSGYALTMIGFMAGGTQPQSSYVVWRLCALTLLAGPFISMIALIFIMKYPVTKSLLNSIANKKGSITFGSCDQPIKTDV
ncbi:MAG: hypothetical protein A2Y12_09435 [Planctomycetes bacterium GWF2_42_9]|nr:MAG: hypothetical protein A2Y12_09435 [Planctomycetes bacterium GWF2_42_9]